MFYKFSRFVLFFLLHALLFIIIAITRIPAYLTEQ